MKTNEITMNTESPTPVVVPPATPAATAPLAPVAPIIAATAPQPAPMPAPAPVNPAGAKARKGGKKNKAPAFAAKP